jgi:hypothetical protein
MSTESQALLLHALHHRSDSEILQAAELHAARQVSLAAQALAISIPEREVLESNVIRQARRDGITGTDDEVLVKMCASANTEPINAGQRQFVLSDCLCVVFVVLGLMLVWRRFARRWSAAHLDSCKKKV